MNAQRASPAAALLACLALAACGGGDTSTAPAASTTSSSSSSTTADGPSNDDLRRAFEQALMMLLTQQEGLTHAQAQCAIDALAESVTDEQLQAGLDEIRTTGEPPKDLIDQAFDAGAACAGE